ncbi:hypothetical protein EV701_1337 [Chthoniobacter flavus]|nr:hypothetical protein EV701_1337 [Chthoniobacter flavus]
MGPRRKPVYEFESAGHGRLRFGVRRCCLTITHIFFKIPRREEVPANHANHANKILPIRVICVIRGPHPQSF